MTPTGTAAPSAPATVVTAGNDTPGEAPRTDPGAGPGAPTRGRLAQIRAGLTRAEWASILGMAGFVVLLHVVGWGCWASSWRRTTTR